MYGVTVVSTRGYTGYSCFHPAREVELQDVASVVAFSCPHGRRFPIALTFIERAQCWFVHANSKDYRQIVRAVCDLYKTTTGCVDFVVKAEAFLFSGVQCFGACSLLDGSDETLLGDSCRMVVLKVRVLSASHWLGTV